MRGDSIEKIFLLHVKKPFLFHKSRPMGRSGAFVGEMAYFRNAS